MTRRVGTPFGENDRDSSWSSGSSGSNPSQSNGPSRTGEDADGGAVPPRSLDAWPRSDQHAATEPARTSAGSRRCRHCGVENESDETFTLCWNCAREL
ncbi:DUF7577 domain-containing protein [Salinigranum marinum]|uniref:DUF7577 domain-containing protein n=1 Tax=Salinigranum marinum TaxID=1515595 RepID=UPI003CCD593F